MVEISIEALQRCYRLAMKAKTATESGKYLDEAARISAALTAYEKKLD